MFRKRRKQREDYALALWCLISGLPREEGLRRDAEARRRAEQYGPPLEPPPEDDPWPDTITCADCGGAAEPFQRFTELLTDVPQHRWIHRFRCMPCYDAHTVRKWQAMARSARERRDRGDQ